MDKLRKYKINIVISLVILCGFVFVIFVGGTVYEGAKLYYERNQAELISSKISSEIDKELYASSFLAKFLSNSGYVKRWLINGRNGLNYREEASALHHYFDQYRVGFGFDFVSLRPSSGDFIFYDNNALHIITDDPTFFHFAHNEGFQLHSPQIFSDMETKALIICVCDKVIASNGKLLGYLSIGIDSKCLNHIFEEYKSEDVEAYISDENGNVIFGDRNYLFEDDKRRSYVRNIDGINAKLIVVNRARHEELIGIIKEGLLYSILIIVVVIFVCATLIHFYTRHLYKEIYTDSLTGMANRKFFKNYIATAPAGKWRQLFIFDIDGFKSVNDSNGHLFGNRVLVSVALAVSRCLDGFGLAARWGGDEFIGVLSCSAKEALFILESMQNEIKSECAYCADEITISIGFAEIGEDGLAVATANADAALYISKNKGPGLVTLFDSSRDF